MKKFFSALFTILIIAGIGALAYLHPSFFNRQLDKVRSVYYVHKGDKALKKMKLQKAINYYTRAVELFPGHYGAWYNLGNLYVLYEDYYSAVDAYEKAFEYNPKMIIARMNYGIVSAEKLGDFDGAIDQYNEILKTKRHLLSIPFVYSNVKSVKGNRGIAYYNKGVAYKQKAMYLPLEKRYLMYKYLGEAIAAYKKALKILKKNYDIYYNKAVAHHLRGEYRDAGLDYCKAIELEPMRYEAHYNLAVLLREIHRYRDSVSELQKAAMLILEEPDASELQSAYIFNLLNDVTRKFITSDEYYTQRLSEEPTTGISYTYVNGKIVPDEEFDKAIIKNFKTCAGIDFFNEEEEY